MKRTISLIVLLLALVVLLSTCSERPKDTAGIFHNYYFRVEYATADTVGLSTEKGYWHV